jgi:hypothetical protein
MSSVSEVTVGLWTVLPWLLAVAIAVGLGALGRITDIRSRRRHKS